MPALMRNRSLFPSLYRVVAATCERCGRESPYCAKVAIMVKLPDLPPAFDIAVLTCATCREANVRRWQVATGWHDGIEIGRIDDFDGMLADKFAAWCRENPPLDDMEDDDE